MGQEKKTAARRSFLIGLVTGAGAAVAVSTVPARAVGPREPAGEGPPAPEILLYRRTEETERYYRSLYR